MAGGAFRVEGWTAGDPPAAGWPAIFRVSVGAADAPAVSGSYAVESGTLVFRPRFPISPGLRVSAEFRPPGGAPVAATFEIPAETRASTTTVAHVYPSADALPENQLKFYVFFSAPMRRGEAWQHVRLLSADGTAIELPFLELNEELWNRDNTRLTILFDPGRIKRGLLPLKEIGPSIQAGKQYTLVIARDWPDGNGAPLAAEFRKQFRVTPPDRTPPDPKKWRVSHPASGGTAALTIDFPKPMDYALLQHSIDVAGPGGTVAGSITVDRNETRWSFTPDAPWVAGDYRLVIQTTLEDLAGNHILRAFDVDTFKRVAPIAQETMSLPFRIRRQ
jgi:hypothetical protein